MEANTAGNAFYAPLAADLLARARRGDRSALQAIYAFYRKPAFNLAVRILGDALAAEDVVHDVFVRLIERIADFRGDAPFGAWLRRLVANATIDELRRRQWLLQDEPDDIARRAPPMDDVAEAQVEAWQLLAKLPARARAVLVLHAVEGYTHREMGQLFGQSESYSKSILARTLQRLGERDMQPEEPGHDVRESRTVESGAA
jgi:RNA polymerase sigma factor (sigma-70 family)